MPHAEVSYRREGRNAESSERIRCVAVWAGSGQDLNECLARFLSIQPNETRRELQRLKAEGLLVTPDNPNDPRLTRWLRVEGFTKPRRAYLFVGDAARPPCGRQDG